MARTNTKRKTGKSKGMSPGPEIILKTYDVEAIVAVKPKRYTKEAGQRFEYLIKWYGYPDDQNTWEPHEHLKGCERLLSSLWTEIGLPRKGSRAVIRPSPEWIEAEKTYYRKTYVEPSCGPHHQPAYGYNEQTGELTVYE